MASAEHLVTPEELMACLDGEIPSDRATVIQAHMADCPICQRIAAELRETSSEMARWDVEEPPFTLRATVPAELPVFSQWSPAVVWRRPAVLWQFAGVAAVVVIGLFVTVQPSSKRAADARTVVALAAPRSAGKTGTYNEPEAKAGAASVRLGGSGGRGQSSPARRDVAQSAVPQAVSKPSEGPLIARSAALEIVATNFEDVRPAVDRVLRDVKGFAGQIDASAARGASRSLNATLRVPVASLDDALASLRQLGHVVGETQGGDDVSEQMVDLTARLANGRIAEKRLIDLLQNRTGKVSDVLDAEREIARVRGEIEQLDAQRKHLDRRVIYATVSLKVTEEHKAALDLGLLPVSARFRNALVDGFRSAFEGALAAALALLRVGPSAVLWVLVLAWPARIIWRRWIPRQQPTIGS